MEFLSTFFCEAMIRISSTFLFDATGFSLKIQDSTSFNHVSKKTLQAKKENTREERRNETFFRVSRKQKSAGTKTGACKFFNEDTVHRHLSFPGH
ncbi:hypothetical protein [Thermospira aquatica]|uniref:Secreted protein n=1 Tax=Thermospira aquatica TaxID=2828656 RepID=A0AAX3BD49_9SPIR|nr:hypothetical protein [Thermospira aquatica]URA10244.1 hypothetical protein KDW03_00095 [Thermospira aquatica]